MQVIKDIQVGGFDFRKKPKDEYSQISPTPPVGDDDPYDEGKRNVND